MKSAFDNGHEYEPSIRMQKELSLRQTLSAAKCAEHAARLALSAAERGVEAAEHAMKLAQLREETEEYDDFDMCGEGYPPDVLLFLHREYPTNDPSAKELLRFYGVSVDFIYEALREDLQKYPLEKALQRHHWALSALRFENFEEIYKWAELDKDRYDWIQSYRGYSDHLSNHRSNFLQG